MIGRAAASVAAALTVLVAIGLGSPDGRFVEASAGAAGLESPDGSLGRQVPEGAVAGSRARDETVIRLGRIGRNGRPRVEVMSLDDYIAEVLAGEGQPRAGAAAQRALAITARTFALANRHRHRAEGFDLCDTTHCQVVRPATDATRDAARSTSGQVLLSGGQPAPVFYSAWCGGHLEYASQVWPGARDFDHPRDDDACAGEPSWESEIRARDLERALRAAGLKGRRLRRLRILRRNQSGRVLRLRADGFTPAEISGTDFRMAVGRVRGWQALKSTSFDLEPTRAGYRFHGRGFGHGVGLCVVGAGARAARGESAADILGFYFPSLTVGPAGGDADTGRVNAARPSTAAPKTGAAIPTRTTDVLVALPPAEESQRDALLSLVRQARDAVVRASGRAAPGQLAITVHPTVESFGRATGQPWWVPGATVGASVDLLPLSALSRRGVLESTVRHEVAHALLDAALADRPLWVREGAAIYFSRPPGEGTVSGRSGGRVSCPDDEELLRPVSAGAYRDAFERAGQCFSRAIASGRRWTDIR